MISTTFVQFRTSTSFSKFSKKLLPPAFNLTCLLTHCLLLFSPLTGTFILLKLLLSNFTVTSSLRWIVVRPLHSFFSIYLLPRYCQSVFLTRLQIGLCIQILSFSYPQHPSKLSSSSFLSLQPQLSQIHLSPANLTIAIHLLLWHLTSKSQRTSTHSKFIGTCQYKQFKISTHHTNTQKLHWLPIKQRIDYKICLLTHKTLTNQQPTYLYSSLSFPSHSVSTWSSDSLVLSIPYVRSSLGKRAFSVIGPRPWNSLPPDTRNSSSLLIFRSRLKTHFFKIAFPP